MDKNHKDTIELLQQSAQELPLLIPNEQCWNNIQQNVYQPKPRIKPAREFIGIAASLFAIAILGMNMYLSTHNSITQPTVQIDEKLQQLFSEHDVYWRVREIDQQLSQHISVKQQQQLMQERELLVKQSISSKTSQLVTI